MEKEKEFDAFSLASAQAEEADFEGYLPNKEAQASKAAEEHEKRKSAKDNHRDRPSVEITWTRLSIKSATAARLNIAKLQWIQRNGQRITTDDFLNILLNVSENTL